MKRIVDQISLCSFLLLSLVFKGGDAHVYLTKNEPDEANAESCERKSPQNDVLYTTDTQNLTLALVGGYVLLTPQLELEGCSFIKPNINPLSHAYSSTSEDGDGLYKCFYACKRESHPYHYIGMDGRLCTCLMKDDLKQVDKCTEDNSKSCGFFHSTRCSTKHNLVALYKIKGIRINDPVACDGKETIYFNQHSFNRSLSTSMLKTRGVRIIKNKDELASEQHCCIAAYTKEFGGLTNPMVHPCNTVIPQACVTNYMKFNRSVVYVVLAIIFCGLGLLVLASVFKYRITRRRSKRTMSIEQVQTDSTGTITAHPLPDSTVEKRKQAGSDANDWCMLLTEVLRRLNGNIDNCSINISFFSNGVSDGGANNNENRVSIIFDNKNLKKYEKPSVKIPAHRRKTFYTPLHTYRNGHEFHVLSTETDSAHMNYNEVELFENNPFTDVQYEIPLDKMSSENSPLAERHQKNICFHSRNCTPQHDQEYDDGFTPHVAPVCDN